MIAIKLYDLTTEQYFATLDYAKELPSFVREYRVEWDEYICPEKPDASISHTFMFGDEKDAVIFKLKFI